MRKNKKRIWTCSRWKEVFLGIVKHPHTSKMPQFNGVKHKAASEDQDMPIQNILIWQFDGTSRSYYQHNLPKTWAFLESLLEVKSGQGGFLLRGHNTVGWNSLPNMAALWTGKDIVD
jgi:hypothetical protein